MIEQFPTVLAGEAGGGGVTINESETQNRAKLTNALGGREH